MGNPGLLNRIRKVNPDLSRSMSFKKAIKAVPGTLALFTTVSALQAQTTVLTNLPGSPPYTGNRAEVDSLATSNVVGLTTSGNAVDFSSFTGYFENLTSVNVTLGGGIYSNNSGSPGSSLVSFTSQTVLASDTTPTSFSLTTTSPYLLAANTSYWFLLSAQSGNLYWMADSSNAGTGTVPTASQG